MPARSFKSGQFNFRPTTVAAALMAAGSTANPKMVREPKLMVIRADGQRIVL